MISTRQVPTPQDATVAAERLIEAYENIFVVLLHGSVARGEATEGSDIDLVAVFADLDYATRRDLRSELETRATDWLPFPVQVHPTDLPEWATRSTRVPCSFEANVMSGNSAVVAAGNAQNGTLWNKEQNLASSNLNASLDYLWSYLGPKLRSLEVSLEPNSRMAAQEKLDQSYLLDRMREICEDSSLAVEVALKALAALRGEHPVTEKDMKKAGHNIGLCLNQLPRPYRLAMTDIVTSQGLRLGSLSSWRTRGTYPDDRDANGYYAYDRVDDYILTALSVASAVISEFESVAASDDARLSKTRRRWQSAAEMYDSTDTHSREERLTPLRIITQLEAIKIGVIPGQAWLFDSPEL